MILTYCSLSFHSCHFGPYQMCSDCILVAWSLFNILQSVEYHHLFHFWMLESTNPSGMQSSRLQMDLCKTTSLNGLPLPTICIWALPTLFEVQLFIIGCFKQRFHPIYAASRQKPRNRDSTTRFRQTLKHSVDDTVVNIDRFINTLTK